jgi:hypothetical protein
MTRDAGASPLAPTLERGSQRTNGGGVSAKDVAVGDALLRMGWSSFGQESSRHEGTRIRGAVWFPRSSVGATLDAPASSYLTTALSLGSPPHSRMIPRTRTALVHQTIDITPASGLLWMWLAHTPEFATEPATSRPPPCRNEADVSDLDRPKHGDSCTVVHQRYA